MKTKNLLMLLTIFATTLLHATVPNFRVDVLNHSGRPDSESIVVTIVGDGFAANEQEAFMGVARAFRDSLLNTKSFNVFTDQINIYAIRVVSDVSSA